MKNNSLMGIILSTELHVKLLKHFSLYEKIKKIKQNESLVDNLKSNIVERLYDIMNPIFVEQYANGVNSNSITGITFKDRVKSFEKVVDSPTYIADLFIDYPILQRIIFITLNDYLDSINEIPIY